MEREANDKVVPADFTGDGKADIAVSRSASGRMVRFALGRFFFLCVSTDTLAPSDYDGDGRADAAVFRPSNVTWYASRSSNGSVLFQTFGVSGDLSVPNAFVP